MPSARRILIVLFALLAGQARAESTFALVDFNVVPMTSPQTLSRYTVIVRDRTIVELGPVRKVRVPNDAKRIEGHGRLYLLPGLSDMHVHASRVDDFAPYVANGVTTVLHMGGEPVGAVGRMARMLDFGPAIAPRVFFSLAVNKEGIPGFAVDSPEHARAAVDLAKANGYDFIKVRDGLSAPVFEAIVVQAKLQQLGVIGHGVREVGLPASLFQGQVMVAHAEEFLYTAFDARVDDALMEKVVQDTRRSGGYVTPNLILYETIAKQWGKPDMLGVFLRDRRARQLTPNVRADWINSDYVHRQGTIEKNIPILRKLTGMLAKAGVPLLVGTDSPPIPGVFPGHSVHDEMQLLTEAGLTPYEALAAATRTPGEFIAKFVPQAQPFGLVAKGHRADLICVEANPLDSLSTLRKPVGVLRAGRWLTSSDLTTALEQIAAKYEALH